MIVMKRALLFILLFQSIYSHAQHNYRSPLDIPIVLSANFAELRPNHFHSGIDLKTAGIINKPVYAIEDGYVSRISVSPSGYGLALYLTHTTGQMSVYGHLEKFAPKIAEYVKNKQYEFEQFRVDLKVEKDLIPVKKSDFIAYSGNTGSSFGPHVHFEIRSEDGETALDPLPYYKNQIKDTEPPQIKAIAVYPIDGKGVVNGKAVPFRHNIATTKKAKSETIQAWGTIGVGVNAIDKMTGTTNIYGVKSVRLTCDGAEIFHSDISDFSFAQTRMINSLTDYDYWYKHKSFYMKSFVEPGNKLPIYKTINNGYINIDKEKIYKLKYELEDLYGNKRNYQFEVVGKKQSISAPKPCSLVMTWEYNNYYLSDDFKLIVPKGYLYDDIGFVLEKKANQKYFSPIYSVHNKHIPLDAFCDMTIKLENDTLSNKAHYGIVRKNGTNELWIGGEYNDGKMTAKIRELGHEYAVSYDSRPPTITPMNPARWTAQRKIVMRMSDNKSGIKSYKGTIDGEFVLFENDAKKPDYTYNFDPKRLEKGKTHKFVFTATDACGNTATYEYEFKY